MIITHENKTLTEQILIEFLPSGVGKDLKVESIGDIKILDLTPEQISYKDFIGNILLEVFLSINMKIDIL